MKKKILTPALFILTIIFTIIAMQTVALAYATPEEMLEKVILDRENIKSYVDAMYFSDVFKADVINKELHITPEDFSDCMLRTVQKLADDNKFAIEWNMIPDYTASIVYTNKKTIDENHLRLEYDIVRKENGPEAVEKKTHDVTFLTKIDGNWRIDLMSEYLEKKGEPFLSDYCDRAEIDMRRIIEQGGLTPADGAALSARRIAVDINGEKITASDFDKNLSAELTRGEINYTLGLPSNTTSQPFTSSYDWNGLKKNLESAQKIADVLSTKPEYATLFRGRYEYRLNFTDAGSGLWSTETHIKVNPSDKEDNRTKKVALIVNTNVGTIRSNIEGQNEIDKVVSDNQERIWRSNQSEYMKSLKVAGFNALSFSLVLFLMFIVVKKIEKASFSSRCVVLNLLLIILIWFVCSFLATSFMAMKVMGFLHIPVFHIVDIIFFPTIIMSVMRIIGLIAVGFLFGRLLYKTGSSMRRAIFLVTYLELVMIFFILFIFNLVS